MQIENKKIVEMLIVCLPCHFGYGKAPVPCARQADNEHLSNLFIYHMHSFLLRMLHTYLIMVMLQVSTMIRHGLG